jgi:ferredoxin-type protein NapH
MKPKETGIKAFIPMGLFLTIFTALAVGLWRLTGEVFYLLNFLLIGCSLALGMGLWPVLPRGRKRAARVLSQLLVGGYMFFGLGAGLIYAVFGYLRPEDMQIEGFWFWLFAGSFAAAVLHYLIAKIFGPLAFGRGWCGWACWTAAVLDVLPWGKSPGRAPRGWGHLRHGLFAASLLLVAFLVFGAGYGLPQMAGKVWLNGAPGGATRAYASLFQIPELLWFLGGNALYYAAGLAAAVLMKDNRAFCKYLCPIAPFLKLGSRFSLLKVSADPGKCTKCGACEKKCPMDIRIREYTAAGRRVASSECILCQSCIDACPRGALGISLGLDAGFKERLRYKKD